MKESRENQSTPENSATVSSSSPSTCSALLDQRVRELLSDYIRDKNEVAEMLDVPCCHNAIMDKLRMIEIIGDEMAKLIKPYSIARDLAKNGNTVLSRLTLYMIGTKTKGD